MTHYGREYRQQGFRAGPRYDIGYGAGGYAQGRGRSGPGTYQEDYEGVAFRWGAGGFYGGPGYADPDRRSQFKVGGHEPGFRRSMGGRQTGRPGYGSEYRGWVRGGYPDEETWGGAYTGYTRYDSGYFSQMPRWPWEGRRG